MLSDNRPGQSLKELRTQWAYELFAWFLCGITVLGFGLAIYYAIST